MLIKNYEITSLTATEFLERFAIGDVSSLEYAEALSSQIRSKNENLRAFCFFDEETFLERARQCDKIQNEFLKGGKSGLALPLLGLPVGVKDIFNTADMPTARGSSIYSEYQPGNDARVVTNLRRAGANIIGKTSTAEFAVHYDASTRNPWDSQRTAGTSSSGSACSVAAMMSPVALGSQTAASIIRPSSYCGVVGYKPSFGLVPRTAMLKTTDTLDTIGWISRSTNDALLLLDHLRVSGPNYPIIEKYFDSRALSDSVIQPKKIGILTDDKLYADFDSTIQKQFESLVQVFVGLGLQIERTKLPKELRQAHRCHELIYSKCLSYYFREEWARCKDQFSEVLSNIILRGQSISLDQYKSALNEQVRLRHYYDELFSRFDFIVCPSAAQEAPRIENIIEKPDFSLIFTMCLAPTISLPGLNMSNKMPLGLQISGKRFDDFKLLNFAKFLEKALVN